MTEGPRHIAIIMDGNGRWALDRGLDRMRGHQKGAKVAFEIVEHFVDLQIPNLTLYAFSTENWLRPKSEVLGLMALLESYLKKDRIKLIELGVRVRAIGDMSRLSRSLQKAIGSIESETKSGTRLNLNIALSYGGRDEIVRACKKICSKVQKGEITVDDIDEKTVSNYLDTKDIEEPDLLIRTSGEQRLSNFLLWQLSYAELYFTKIYWPDFGREQLESAINNFIARKRKFGKLPV